MGDEEIELLKLLDKNEIYQSNGNLYTKDTFNDIYKWIVYETVYSYKQLHKFSLDITYTEKEISDCQRRLEILLKIWNIAKEM